MASRSDRGGHRMTPDGERLLCHDCWIIAHRDVLGNVLPEPKSL